jgi:hypothetical protein
MRMGCCGTSVWKGRTLFSCFSTPKKCAFVLGFGAFKISRVGHRKFNATYAGKMRLRPLNEQAC